MVDGILSAGRSAAESLMTDEGRALRPTGRTYDSVAKREVDTFADLFVSRCKIQTRDLIARTSEVGGRSATTVRLEIHLPIDTPPLTVGDVWEVTTSGPTSTATVGRRFRVTGPVEKSHATARRYEAEAIVT